jgi:2-keto-3-deoxy-L-arabinonate dehydratase
LYPGMLPIMPTVVDQHSDIDAAGQRRVIQYCLQCGAVAIGHFGFASEFHKLTETERVYLIELIVREVDGRVPVFIGVTSPSNRIAMERARAAASMGVDMLLAAIPYVTVPDKKEVISYFEALSSATALPIIVQDTPLSATMLDAQTLLRMATGIEHLDYIKMEGDDALQKSAELLRISEGTARIIGGYGGKHMIHLLRLGVTSFMTGTEALDLHASVVSAYLGGRQEEATKIYYERIMPYLSLYMDHPDELLKYMLHVRGVIDCEDTIAPLGGPRISESEQSELDWVLDRIGFREKQWPHIP